MTVFAEAAVNGVPVTLAWVNGRLVVDGPPFEETQETFDAIFVLADTPDAGYPPGAWLPDAFRAAADAFDRPEQATRVLATFQSGLVAPGYWQFSWPRRDRPPAHWFHVAAHIPPLRHYVRRCTAAPIRARRTAAEGTGLAELTSPWMLRMTTPRWWIVPALVLAAVITIPAAMRGYFSVGTVFTVVLVLFGGPIALVGPARLMRRAFPEETVMIEAG